MSEQQNNAIVIDGKEYKPEDLTDQQNYIVSQIRDLQEKAADLKFKLDQVNAASNAFTTTLLNSVKEEQGE